MNWALIEQRRIARGLTHHELSARVGSGVPRSPSRLWRDADHDVLPLAVLERLCAVLGLHPVEVFATPTRAAERRTTQAVARAVVGEAVADDVVIEAALVTLAVAGVTGPVSSARLAEALGWPLDRLAVAVAALDERLAATGTRLDLNPDGALYGLQPRHSLLSSVQRDALHQLRVLTGELDENLARALHQVISGYEHSETRRALPSGVAVRLQQLGLVQRRHNSTILDLTRDDIADDVRAALWPDSHPHTHPATTATYPTSTAT